MLINIGDVVRVKTQNGIISNGQIGIIAETVGDNYYYVSFDGEEFLYADVELEVLC